jgi:hypothetical protein
MKCPKCGEAFAAVCIQPCESMKLAFAACRRALTTFERVVVQMDCRGRNCPACNALRTAKAARRVMLRAEGKEAKHAD